MGDTKPHPSVQCSPAPGEVVSGGGRDFGPVAGPFVACRLQDALPGEMAREPFHGAWGCGSRAGGAGLRAGVRVSPQDAVPPEEASLVEERSRKGPARPAAQAECQPWPAPQSSPRPHNPPWTELRQAPQPRLPRKATASPDCLQTRSPRRESLLRHRLTLQPRALPDPPNPFHRGKSLLLQWARGGQQGTGAPPRHPTSLLHFPASQPSPRALPRPSGSCPALSITAPLWPHCSARVCLHLLPELGRRSAPSGGHLGRER